MITEALALKVYSIILKGDSLLAHNALIDLFNEVDWSILTIIEDCKNHFKLLKDWKFVHVLRGANHKAHELT